MKNFVEFYFTGVSLAGQEERQVASREIDAIGKIPDYAISCRFFSKDGVGNKIDFSPYYFFGQEYTSEDFKKKYPQLAKCDFVEKSDRIVSTTVVGFHPLSKDDIVVPI